MSFMAPMGGTPCDLLRLTGEWRGTEHRTRASQERAPVYHWITLSARINTD